MPNIPNDYTYLKIIICPIKYCLLSSTGTVTSTALEFIAFAGPPYTAIRNNTIPVNKGNIASIYTSQFNDQATINGLEIRDLVMHRQEQEEQEKLEILNRDVVKPFQWSESNFSDVHKDLPDVWDFQPYKPNWSW